jgi:hypothetical protein
MWFRTVAWGHHIDERRMSHHQTQDITGYCLDFVEDGVKLWAGGLAVSGKSQFQVGLQIGINCGQEA